MHHICTEDRDLHFLKRELRSNAGDHLSHSFYDQYIEFRQHE